MAATVNVAGDADDVNGPVYASFGNVIDASPSPVGTTVTQRIDRSGVVTDDSGLANHGVTIAVVDDVTNHAIAAPFWDFMNSTGTVFENSQYNIDTLFENPYFATGRPVSEAYWANVKVAGTPRDVLIQCFERRCLTYTPGNPEGFVVEAGNVGQHCYQWRYGAESPLPDPEPTTTPTWVPDLPTPTPEPTAPVGGSVSFGDGIWIVGVDIEPGIYRNDNTTDLCYWARLSGLSDTLDDIITNDLSSYRTLVEIKPTDYAFESNRCGTWSSDLSAITPSPTSSFGDGTYFVGTEVSPGIWRNTDSSDSCYWARLSGFGGTLDEINANEFADVGLVVEISATDVGFTSSRCGNWIYDPGPVTTNLTADFTGGTYIVGLDIQAGTWETDHSPEGCYWARLAGFSGELRDIIDNEFISDDEASSLPQRVRIAPSDDGFFTESECGTWHYVGP